MQLSQAPTRRQIWKTIGRIRAVSARVPLLQVNVTPYQTPPGQALARTQPTHAPGKIMSRPFEQDVMIGNTDQTAARLKGKGDVR